MKNILPFYMHPSSWGKKGIDREIAEARYNMGDGEEFEAEKEKIVLIRAIYRHCSNTTLTIVSWRCFDAISMQC